MIGSDFPFPWTTTAVGHVLKTPGVSDDQKRAMLGETTAKTARHRVVKSTRLRARNKRDTRAL